MLFIEIIKSLFIYSNFHPFYFTKLVFLFCWMWMHLRAAQWSSPSLWFFSRGVIQASILANKLTIKTLMRSQKKNLLNLPPPPSHSHRSFFSQITFCCFFLKEPKKWKILRSPFIFFLRSAVCPNGIYESMQRRERGLMKIIKGGDEIE